MGGGVSGIVNGDGDGLGPGVLADVGADQGGVLGPGVEGVCGGVGAEETAAVVDEAQEGGFLDIVQRELTAGVEEADGVVVGEELGGEGGEVCGFGEEGEGVGGGLFGEALEGGDGGGDGIVPVTGGGGDNEEIGGGGGLDSRGGV